MIHTGNLEAQIALWPESVKDAWIHYTNAQAEVARLDQALERALMIMRLDELDDAALDAEDESGGEDWRESVSGGAALDMQRRVLTLEHQVQMALAEVDRAKAACDVRIRSAAQANGLKLTEAAVEARVDTDPAVIAAQDRAIELKHQRALLKLEQEEEWHTLREQQGLAERAGALEEPEQVRRLRSELEDARARMASARIEVRYQQAVGRSLRLLTHVGRFNS